MRWTKFAVYALAVTLAMGVSTARAQRGTGEATGVGQQAEKPEVVSLSGKVVEVKTGPCENATGRSPFGTHFLIETKKGKTLNIHLGPAAAVEFLAEDLSAGKKVEVKAFRTERMEEGHYVAQTVTLGDRTVQLRDETLQPVWAGGPGGRGPAAGAPAGPGWGRGQGPGYGRGGGYWRGDGRGYGPQRGRGPGWGCYYGRQGRW